LFLFYSGTKEQVRLLRGTDREVSSNKSEGKRPLGTNLLWMDCEVYVLYCAEQQNVHSRCELQSETLPVVTCGELLAVCIVQDSRMCTAVVNWRVKHCLLLHVENC
jgi:hypothetical protein